MIAHPAQLLIVPALGLIALAVLAGAMYLLYGLNRRRIVTVRTPRSATAISDAGAVAVAVAPGVAIDADRRRKAITLAVALAMLLWVFAGRHLVGAFHPAATEAMGRPAATPATVRGASGAELALSHYGQPDAPTLLFTHGWGADRRDWEDAIGMLAPRFHVVAWDLPGLGASTSGGNDQSMQAMAADLDSVVSSLARRPVVLIGHSIGGMLNIEYARRFPQKLGREVRAIVQANTTFTNPIETKKGAELSRKLQKPVFEPLLHVVEWTSPLVRMLGWLAYQSGLAHLQLAMQSFAGNETREQLDDMAKYFYHSSPGVIARGVLGMLHWDGSDVLPKIDVPTLIISGDEDTTTLPAASDRMQRDIRASRRLSVGGAAHLGPVERYKVYGDAIGAFADEAASGTAAK